MSIEIFGERVSAMQKVERKLGEVAALLSDMADGLSQYPDGVIIRGAHTPLPAYATVRIDAYEIRAHDWPTLEEIQQLLNEWHAELHRARLDWIKLPPCVKELVLQPGTQMAAPDAGEPPIAANDEVSRTT